MATATNDITGDRISTKHNSKAFVDAWAGIFAKKQVEVEHKHIGIDDEGDLDESNEQVGAA